MHLNVSEIQHFSLGDGDGIRTTVFLKGCNLRCPWCHNPETVTGEAVTLRYQTGALQNGRWMTTDEIAAEVIEDFDFYGRDGGVTVSGGEPLLQVEGVAALLRHLAECSVPAVVDTAGCVPYSAFEKLGDLVDTYYFDLKACDAEGYRAIGGDFSRISYNLRRLIADGQHVHVRIPLIPGWNDTPAYTEKMCAVLRDVGAKEVDLLPFHRLGSGKYTAMGIPYAYGETPSMTKERAAEIAAGYRGDWNLRIDG